VKAILTGSPKRWPTVVWENSTGTGRLTIEAVLNLAILLLTETAGSKQHLH
jgi:hypothetical protein